MCEYILGISYGHHESSCCLMGSDGTFEYLREEWVSRVKNDFRFPVFALNYLKNKYPDLEKNISTVCLHQKPLKNWLGIGTRKNLSIQNYLNKIKQFKKSDIFFEREFKKIFSGKTNFYYCPHHLSHLYTAEYLLGIKDSGTLNIILDGYGEGLSGAIYKGQAKDIKLIKEYKTLSSFGIIYSGITEWCGFKPNEDEYKVMALAGYGKTKFVDYIDNNIIHFNESTLDISINKDYFNFEDSSKNTVTQSFIKKFGSFKSNKPILDQPEILNCICSFQYIIEKTVISLIAKLVEKNKNVNQVFLSGGLFNNSKLVGEITKKIQKKILVSPSPGDAGSSIGAAYFTMLCLDKKFIIKNKNPYIGPRTPSIKNYTHLFSEYKSENTYSKIIEILSNDETFAVFSGFSEVGPRALLSRSLCCNAKSKIAIDNLNTKLKKRESFRPIAPVIHKNLLLEKFEYNDASIENLFWMGQLIWPRTDKKVEEYPFYHIDKSVRAQVFDDKLALHRKFIPSLLQKLLNEGYILGNTSLNIAGEPMVFLPEDLYINCKRLEVKYVLQDNLLYEVI
jgi:carbamoyltransferase